MSYLSKVWTLTTLIPPFLFWITIGILKNEKISSYLLVLPVLLTTIIAGFVLSIPTMILLYKVNHKIRNSFLEMWKTKTILSVLSITGIVGTFCIIDKSVFLSTKSFLLPLSYLLIMNTSIWIFKNKTE